MLVIFDWDGTLHDSTAGIVQCMQLAASDVGVEVPSNEAVEQIIGLGLPEAIASLHPSHSKAVCEQIRERYVHHFLAGTETPAPFFDGVEEVLTQLLQEGHVLAVATGKSRRGLNRVLGQTQAASFFQATRCADETRSKPDPLMLEELLAELRFMPHEAVMIGDTTFDMQMARALQMPRIGVSYGAHRVSQLQGFDPLTIIDSMYELPTLLKQPLR